MDEIFSGIDPITIEMIKDTIVKLQVTRNITILISDHAFENVLQIADNIFILVGVFIHWDAKNDQKIYDYNYQAVKESIERAINGTPTAKEVVAQKSSAEHPFGKVKV